MKKNVGGRPKKEIDYEMVGKLATIQCTQDEIAEILDISTRTLQRDLEFCRVYKKNTEVGRMSLRRFQWRSAEKGNTSMLIWLGKQYLEQKEPELETANKEMVEAIQKFANKLI